MSNPDGIFSLRIVTADFYMEKPKSGLDPCFSEFRAKEIKKVPIIRIFGSNADGQKTCMHVHGIFPYLYIPYDKKDFESLDKAVYLIASSIDKAINISLGQGSSGSQHVFKIQQVKGVPFYGYHQKEHQYLKVYMLNPRFVRRTANLLQNGAIMGKIFQPHESHVPYILQFFIDYNLYGMSFLHVPKEVLKFRRKDQLDVVHYPTQEGQILDCNIAQKQSTSQLEVDIGSAFILNRFQLVTKTSAHANPGIEAIWQDERVRRQNLSKECDEVPPLEIPPSQGRPDVKPTESEEFFRIGLMNRLQQLDASMDQTMNSTLQSSIVAPASNIKERKRTFNLKKLIANAVYPEECTQEDILTNASFIADHLSNRSSFHSSLRSSKTPSVPESDDVFLDNTIVDEDLVLSLTQPDIINQSLREQDMELLDVMKQLGEREDENGIDLDSSLAPLTQNLDVNSSQKSYDGTDKNAKTSANESRDDDSDNECMNDFTLVMDDMDELLLKLSQTSQVNENAPTVEQLDGADDKLRTPKKSKTHKLHPSTPQTPKSSKAGPRSPRSPRTPNSIAKKYAPLPLVIQSRSLRKNQAEAAKAKEASPFLNDCISISSGESDWFDKNRDQFSLRKRLAIGEIRRKSMSTDSDWSGLMIKTSGRGRKASVDLDKTQITCNFRAARKICEKRLKVYCAESETDSDPSTRCHTEEQLDESQETPQKNSVKRSLHSLTNGNNKSPRVLIKKSPRIPDSKRTELSPQDTSKKSNVIDLTADENNSPTLAKMSPRVLMKKFPHVDDTLCRTSPHGCNGNGNKSSSESESVSPLETNRNGNILVSPKDCLSPRVVVKKCLKIKELQKQSSVEESEVESQTQTHSVNSNEGMGSPRVKIKKCPLITKAIARTSEEKFNLTPVKTKLSPSVVIRTSPFLNKLMQSELGEVEKKITDSSEKNPRAKRKMRLSLKSHKIIKGKKDSKPEADLLEAICSSDHKRRRTPSATPTKKLRIELKRLKLAKAQSQETPPSADKKPYSVIVNNEYELIPVAGPSHRDRFIVSSLKTPNKTTRSIDSLCTDDNDELNVHSFYEKSFLVDSPSVFSEISAPSPGQFLKCTQSSLSPTNDNVVIITPHHLPETYEEVEENCKNYDIPEVVHQAPFYSSDDDVTHRKEVGHMVLRIPGRSLNDVDDFESRISGLEGFSHSRKLMMQSLGGTSSLNDDRIREYLSTEKTVLIEPLKLPPTKQDAKVWLKARELLKEKDAPENKRNVVDDSPIKIRRQKVVMLMENELGDSGAEDMDCSMRSLSLTPLTPLTKSRNQTPTTLKTNSCTPLTAPRSGNRKVKGPRLLRAKVSLSQKLKDMCVSNALEKCNGEDVPHPIACVPTEKLLKTMISCEDDVSGSQCSSKSNETVSSEAVLAELEKSSFVKNLHSSQGTLDNSFGISMATLNNTFGFKVNLENLQQAKSDVEHNFLTTLSLEVFVSTREDLHPNPEFDAILCIFYAIENSIPSTCAMDTPAKVFGFIIVSDETEKTCAKFNGIDADAKIKVVTSELQALAELLELCARWDPDIFVGYEIEMSSWGYVMERAKYLDLNIAPLLSRVPSQKVRDFVDEDRDQLTDLDTETKLCGRILLDVWRLMRSEIALTSYSFENVVYHILHRRCPLHSHKDLTQWFRVPQTRWIVLEYFLERVRGTLELLDQLDLIGRTSEMAKLIGIQFYEVLSRGSQFRVESMMLRIAKPKNLVPLSPSVQQRAHMRAPEYLPLILEPQSRFYPDPVIVLDFQSLYPSMIMAYNYCFSTCLGRVEHLGQSVPFEFGASQLRVSPTLLKRLLEHDLVTISPCGVVYVKREIREGILPRMLSEVLDTRQMVKQSMKLHKRSTALQRILHSRQLGLKLIANVTYGYTAANFSGRMPCVEVGDSVVAKGRETLERAIKLVDANKKWNVNVVYGDTDSLFVLVPGRSKEEAFRIGAEIAELVTQDNPQPVKLKLEKVYQPCILQTKKRYVGYMYESADQQEPIFEAKGIETVRRDGCPAASKMLEKCLKILFESADVSQVKGYVCRQFTKLLSGKANIQDLIFAKEFRGLNGYKPTACVPALELTRKWIQTDPRKIPRRGERVPFIVTNGPPGVPLIKLVRSPRDVLADEGLKINAIYYITKAIIPPLNRCLLLIGADVNEWFTNLPRKILFTPALSAANEIIATNASKKSTISQYFSSTNCIIDCGRQTKLGVCSFCALDAMKTVVTLEEKISKFERSYFLTQAICQACTGRPYLTNCTSFDCPVLYVLEVKRRELNQITHMKSILAERYQS